ncbi:HAD family hydrolase [Streptomyces ovatisporus]|uniref:phosphoserine phosphatase n=1 Tax=Streptomyces ovatisporus TaxID=1128682 RepID=A0ABV9A8C3_9ACTN
MAPPSQSTTSKPRVPPAGRRPRLHLFDLDGTLIHGSSAAVEISRQLGLDREIRELELAFSAGALTPPQFAARACGLWSQLTEEHVARAFVEAPWLAGIREVWGDIRERGEHCAVVSLSPDFFVSRLLRQAPPSSGENSAAPGAPTADSATDSGTATASGASGTGAGSVRTGADAAYGSRWPAIPFREPVNPAGILSAAAKVRIADELCAQFGVSRNDCVAYGDSMSDAELFAEVPVSVAVNADRHLQGLASFEYCGRDLREAYGLVGTRP